MKEQKNNEKQIKTKNDRNPGERLRIVRKMLFLTQKQLGEIVGVTQGYCGGIENSRYRIPSDILIKLKEIYGVNPNWILTGEGDMFLDKTAVIDITNKILNTSVTDTKTIASANERNQEKQESVLPIDNSVNNVVSISDFVGLPLMDCKISAGNGSVAINNVKATLMFRRDWLSKFGDPHKLSLIEVVGDSMEPTFKSGDIILVNHNQNTLNKAGGIYAIAMKNEDSIMVKRLQYDYQSGKILVISDNKMYQTFQVSEDEIVINGRVVWYGREI